MILAQISRTALLRFRLALAVSVAVLLSPQLAVASQILDQNNPTAPTNGFCYIGGCVGYQQAFTQSGSNISGAGIQLGTNWAGSGQVGINIWSDTSHTSLIASGISAVVNQNSGWADAFWSPVAVAPSTTMYLQFFAATSGATYLAANYTTPGNIYPNGSLCINTNCLSYTPSYDFAFRTYTETNVPEPASLALLGLGLAGLGFSRRKKQIAA